MTPVRPELPPNFEPNFVKNPIDRFIIAKQKYLGLKHADEADRITLIRRLSFDLIGLPPSGEEVAAFVNDQSTLAYEKLVDRLLASPHFGENMALPWLDLVRFADTIGYHSDNPMNVAPYRDYVIKSFNENKPFDRFTIEQLAGDLLPDATIDQKVASAYNRLLQTTEEGGRASQGIHGEICRRPSPRRVDRLARRNLGMRNAMIINLILIKRGDFYQMAAFFSDVQEVAVGRREPGMPVPDESQASKLNTLDDEVATAEKTLKEATAQLAEKMPDWERSAREVVWEPLEIVALRSAAGTVLRKRPTARSSRTPSWCRVRNRIRSWLERSPRTSPVSRGGVERSVVAQWRAGIGGQRQLRPHRNQTRRRERIARRASGSGDFEKSGRRSLSGRLPDPRRDRRQKRDGLGRLAPGRQRPRGRLRIRQTTWRRRRDDPGDHARFSIDPCSASHRQASDSRFQPGPIPPIAGFRRKFARHSPRPAISARPIKISSLTNSLKRLRLGCVRFATTSPRSRRSADDYVNGLPKVLTSVSGTPRMTRILPRGNWLDETGEIVEPDVPGFLKPQKTSASSKRLTRLDLARWVASRDNPLTARVVVNRLWKQFFGLGISKTVDDLGSQGEWPTHPDLLDWLAVEFMDRNWDLKQIVRLLVTSETYRLASTPSIEQKRVDPFNRFLAHQGRWRLDAELVRDNALTISGLLVPEIGGPSVKPYQPAGYWDALNFPDRTYQADHGPNEYRRGIYTHRQRTFPHPSLVAFDAPSREECVAERARSNIPQQALALLNNPTYVEASRAFAVRIVKAGGASTLDRLRFAFETALSRKPTDREAWLLTDLLIKHLREYSLDKTAAEKLLKVGDQPVPKDVDPLELAAWTSVARVILNLHETITRY